MPVISVSLMSIMFKQKIADTGKSPTTYAYRLLALLLEKDTNLLVYDDKPVNRKVLSIYLNLPKNSLTNLLKKLLLCDVLVILMANNREYFYFNPKFCIHDDTDILELRWLNRVFESKENMLGSRELFFRQHCPRVQSVKSIIDKM